MRSALVLIWCLFGINAVFPLALPAEADYFAKVDDANTHPGQVVDLVSNEEQLLSKRVGRQGYYSNQGSPPVQSYNGGYASNGYYDGNYSNYPNYNRRNYQSQRRRKFGGIGSAIIV